MLVPHSEFPTEGPQPMEGMVSSSILYDMCIFASCFGDFLVCCMC